MNLMVSKINKVEKKNSIKRNIIYYLNIHDKDVK